MFGQEWKIIMIKYYKISLNYNEVLISIDHDRFDENKAFESLKKNCNDIEIYEGKLDTILRWMGLEFSFCCFFGKRFKQTYTFYISNVLDVEYGTIVLLKEEKLIPNMLDYSVCEVQLTNEVNHE